MKSPIYIETVKKKTGETSFLFSKRINVNKGSFPSHHTTFPERYKRKLGDTPSMTLLEAGMIALEQSKAIEHLQSISVRDKAGRSTTTKDFVKAAKTWIWFNDIENLSELRAESIRPTAIGETSGNTLAVLIEAVKSFYRLGSGGHTHATTYTPFGDYLLNILNSGSINHLFSESVDLWAQQTNRGHLPKDSKTMRDAYRFIKSFNDFVGDRPIEQITRANVSSYIAHRCTLVKTTSVDREIHTLRAVWNKAADALDISSRNPFERQAIYGLGLDAERRLTPSCEHQAALISMLEEHPRKSESYVIPMLAIISMTGMRLSEVWGIHAKDYDLANQTLLIRPNEIRKLKTEHSERPFPVLPALAEWLDTYLKMPRSSSANSASAATAKFLDKNGFNLTAHCLRHGFKQRLTEVDTPSNIIEELMGWSNQSMMRHYGINAITNQKRRSIEMVYNKLENPMGIATTFNMIEANDSQYKMEKPVQGFVKYYQNQTLKSEFDYSGRNMASRPINAQS